MTTAEWDLAETRHRLLRKGHDLRVRVIELPAEHDGGHMLIFGEPTDGCLVRIHSRCLYGDALQTDDCDCGPALEKAMDSIQAAGSGILIYLEQEGRGAGLVNKARGLRTSQVHQVDTFSSYAKLGLPQDGRRYEQAVTALQRLGLSSIRLMTNNPDKVRAVQAAGIKVTVRLLHTRPRSVRADAYLEAKRLVGHTLPKNGGRRAEFAPVRRWLRSGWFAMLRRWHGR
ncbi:GTP cyclohydrolase [Nocardia sp. NPDC050175]|uniref:GTP cyclohydrolase n=1 Tax=Nocardia sp. NPDC050175 TaxID=3364317 RepID=UPI0037937D4C